MIWPSSSRMLVSIARLLVTIPADVALAEARSSMLLTS
jgi:hypothetical protein